MQKYAIHFSLFALLLLGLNVPGMGQNIAREMNLFASEQNIPISPGWEELVQEGTAHFQQGYFDQAAQKFAQASLLSPYHPLSSFYLTTSLFALKEYSLGGKTLRRTVNLYPHWNTSKLDLHDFFPPDFELIRKIASFEKWLFFSTRNNDSYFLFGFFCQYSGLFEKAQMAYKILLSKDPSYLEAQKFANMFSPGSPSSYLPNWKKLHQAAQKKFSLEEYSDALDNWSNAYLYYPEKSETLYSIAYSLCALEKYPQAYGMLRLALQIAPNFLTSPFQQSIWSSRRSFDLVLSQLEETLQERPNDEEALFLLSYFYLLNQEKKKANLALEHLKQKHPDDETIRFLQTQVSRSLPDLFSKGGVNQNSLEKRTERQTNKHIRLGEKAFRQEKYSEAHQHFVQAILDNPKNIEARWYLCMSTFAKEEYSSTYRILKEIFQVTPEKISSLDWIRVYRKPEVFEEKLKTLGRWVLEKEKDDQALFVFGYLLIVSDRRDQAKVIFERLQKRLPQDRDVEYFYRLLQ